MNEFSISRRKLLIGTSALAAGRLFQVSEDSFQELDVEYNPSDSAPDALAAPYSRSLALRIVPRDERSNFR